MAKEIVVRIQLDNDAMKEPCDVAMALCDQAVRTWERSLDIPWRLSVTDANGNTCGSVELNITPD